MSNDQRPQRMKIVAGSIPSPVPQRRANDRRDAPAPFADADIPADAAKSAALADAATAGALADAVTPASGFSPLLVALFLGGALIAALAVSLLSGAA